MKFALFFFSLGKVFAHSFHIVTYKIDHFLLSPYALDKVHKIYVDKEPRAWEKPSDHTPLVLEIEL